MTKTFQISSLAAALLAAASSGAMAATAVDLGKVEQTAPAQKLTVTVALHLRDRDAAARYLQEVHTPASPNYHRFLSPAEFRARFAPTDASVERISARLQAAGLGVKRIGSSLLQVSGPAATVQKAFGAEVHVFQNKTAVQGASRYIAPVRASAPAVDLSEVQAVIGLDSRPHFRPHLRQLPNHLQPAGGGSGAPVTGGNAPGQWTVTDLARYYNITPLYNKGIHGKGATIGIVTLASFTPSDAFQYWNQLGLAADPNRLTVVDIDGGPGAPSDDGGSDETTLDVEQSGGIAPAAKIIVYQAPNTTQGFVDAFAQAIESNAADTLSVSWGEWEWFDQQSQAANPVAGKSTDVLQAYHDLFLQAALQGQTLFAAAGDAGAYDVNRAAPLPQYGKVLSVDSPANQQFITAAGATTVPATLTFHPNGKAMQVKISSERTWGWDYLDGLCKALGKDAVACGIFPVGGGGGVSGWISRPFYQNWVPGMQNTPAGQQLVDTSQTPPQVIASVPAHFKGRNVPDISMNGDPETGYVVYYTSSKNGFSVLSNNGGTSFVAPQLAGITALLNQSMGGRLGLLNFSLYGLLATGHAYHGFGRHGAPLRDVAAGGNWGYAAHRGYDQATGVGVPDVANLDAALRRYFWF
ncbi:S53 family peptidase [Chromobacterium sp. CV08]|uniref:S53 family peptidase n=1 Tax=Chromobacterium sp. CV08 TaxID=3133274 RepID=UPI003DA8EA7F